MQKKLQVFITFLILIALVAGLYVFTNWFSVITGYFSGESQQESLAACLSEQGAEFYGTTSCAECARQEDQFGKSFAKINSVDCGKNMQKCPNLREIPAWYIPNSPEKINYGFKTLNELQRLGGCE